MKITFQASYHRRYAAFTLVEMLVVIVMIVILSGLAISAGLGIMKRAAVYRAQGEIQTMSTALEAYKTDKGGYPVASYFANTNAYVNNDPVASTLYMSSSQTLYQALSGKTNYLDTPVTGSVAYMTFTTVQLGNFWAAAGTAGSASTYISDPWGYSYGYSTGNVSGTTTNAPYNGYGFFDLWSTSGLSGGASGKQANTSAWISNWQQ